MSATGYRLGHFFQEINPDSELCKFMAYSVFSIISSGEYKFDVIPDLKWLIIVPNC